MQSPGHLMIGTQLRRRCLFGGEAVSFYIISAIRPVLVRTPAALYPLLPNEELTVVVPDKVGTYKISFECGSETVDYSYFVS